MNSAREVQLWLLRHAHAGDPMKWSGPDDIRPLSDKGRLQAERVGRLLAGTNMRPDAILSSPKLRALETARRAASELGMAVRGVDELVDVAGGHAEVEFALHAAGGYSGGGNALPNRQISVTARGGSGGTLEIPPHHLFVEGVFQNVLVNVSHKVY